MPVKIFFCYAHEDEPLLNKLKTQLSPLRRQGLIEIWHDRDISAGIDWEQEIKEQLNEANIILLLVSPDFIDSDYCYSVEMQQAIERHEQGAARVIPVILRPCLWQEAPFSKLQALPTGAKSVTGSSWRNMDAAFLDITEGVKKAATELVTIKSLLGTKDTPLRISHSLPAHRDPKLDLLVASKDELKINLGLLGNVVLSLSSYVSLQSLLNDLYMKYLKNQFRPYTYGKDWILCSEESEQLIVSWSWLLKSNIDSLSTFDPTWANSAPEAYGLMPENKLVIIDKFPITSYGVATNDKQIASLLTGRDITSKKIRYTLSDLFRKMLQEGKLKSSYTGKLAYKDEIQVDLCPPQEIDINAYKFTFVFLDTNNIPFDKLACFVNSYSQQL